VCCTTFLVLGNNSGLRRNRSGGIGYRVLGGLGIRVDFVDDWCTVNVGRTRLARALGLGPFCGLVPYVLGMADAVCERKKEKDEGSATFSFR
jgi:hypothetical protein